MAACVQCGTVGKPTDKFCNVCGTPLAQAAPPPAAPPGGGYGAPPPGYAPQGYPPPQQGYGAPPPQAAARCQMGHEIAPGASYCAQGHPIALDQMQFPADPYGGGGQGGYAPPPQAPQPQQPQYGAPLPPAGGYGQPPQQGYGAPQHGYTPPPQNAYAPVPSPGFGAPQGYGAPAPAPAQAPYVPQPPPPAAAPAPAPSPMAATAQPQYAMDPTKRILRGFLVAYGINPMGDFWALTSGRHVLGRLGQGEGVDISLQDPTISSRHAAIAVDPNTGNITLEDTGSTNGTFVNDEHIGFNGRRDLRDGDRLRFGGYTTIVKVIGRV